MGRERAGRGVGLGTIRNVVPAEKRFLTGTPSPAVDYPRVMPEFAAMNYVLDMCSVCPQSANSTVWSTKSWWPSYHQPTHIRSLLEPKMIYIYIEP